MNALFSGLMALGAAFLLGGCAHPIKISPDIMNISADSAQQKIDRSVGYFISEKDKALSVTTPAGGGDSVTYAPYADIEPGLYRVLSNTFTSAYTVKDVKDLAFLQSKNITWIFIPTITTNSSSRNNFFWAPTDFTVTIECTATDGNGQQVWKTTVKADGDLVAVSAVSRDPGRAGRSAAEKALSQLQMEILAAPEFRK